MVITGLLIIQDAEPGIMTGGPWVWADVREDGEDELVWEFEN